MQVVEGDGSGPRMFARCIRGADVGIDRLLPHAEADENVRRHVQGVGRRRRNLRIGVRRVQSERRETRVIEAVNQVMRDPGMIGMLVEQPVEDRRRLLLIGVGLVGRDRHPVRDELESIEDRRLVIVRKLRRQPLHCRFVGASARVEIDGFRVAIEERDRVDVGALARRVRAGRRRLLCRSDSARELCR